MQDYADWAISQLSNEAQKVISSRLYRSHALLCRDFYIKDLSLLGRDLSKTIIVDNIAENFLLQPDNGINIKSWYDEIEDNCLMQLCPLLLGIINKKIGDVRQALKDLKKEGNSFQE